jgi:dTDP-4-dehydrorhamnose 3,5-epimerase
MKVTPLNIPDVLLIEPRVFEDERGFFFESFNLEEFRKASLLNVTFVQDNHSKSKKGVIRGLHYQTPNCAQGKLVRVIQGEVFDVAVDLRRSSPNFGKYTSQILSADNKKQLWIPEGFAHGFLTLSTTSEMVYKTTNFYCPECERSILWSDNKINIDWPKDINISVSLKDSLGSNFENCELFS